MDLRFFCMLKKTIQAANLMFCEMHGIVVFAHALLKLVMDWLSIIEESILSSIQNQF